MQSFHFEGSLKIPPLNPEILCNAIQNVTEKFPMTKEKVLKQRRKYLVDAFADIREDTIQRIQKLYHLDFILFGYKSHRPV